LTLRRRGVNRDSLKVHIGVHCADEERRMAELPVVSIV